jgi:serine/threonine protein kinase
MEGGPRIGSYVVREVLGQGGMGTVYLAEHAVIGKKVAIKVLKRDLAGHDNLVARFINEARANAVVGHPGIVDVFDVGTLPSGVPYLVMEYLRGESLAQRLARTGKLPVELAATIAWETASAVGAAHAKGIIHRDLKPENLFLAVDPAEPEAPARVKVLDFGIAKLHADPNPNQVNTQTGSVMGTPVYMSPEQCRGAREEIDHRTDIYSLGVILYEMLVGKPPFQGEAFGDLLLRHMTEPVVPPATLDPTVPAALDAAVLRALAKKRDDRFASMAEFQHGLAETLGRPLEKTPAPFDSRRLPGFTPPSPLTPSAPTARTRLSGRRLLIAGGAVVLGTVAILALASGRQPPAPVPPASVSVHRVEPLPPPAPSPDAAAAVIPAVAKRTGERPAARPAAPSGRKRAHRNKIEVKQW